MTSEARFSLDALAVVAEDLTVRRRRGAFVVTVGQREIVSGPEVLLILAAFSSQRSVASALNDLTKDASTPTQVAVVMEQLRVLLDAGVLTTTTQPLPRMGQSLKRFDSAPVHIRMLNDQRRTLAFQEAIRRAVEPDSVVLDIGTGTGVLALTAAHAGARQVFAIERTAVAEAAQAMFEHDATGSRRVSLIRGHSTDLVLPEKAHVLVSEIIGNDPLGERIVETFWDARERLLLDEPQLIPRGLDVYGLAVEVPPDVLSSHRFSAESAREWSAAYGLDFTPLVAVADEQQHRLSMNSFRTRGWPRMSEELLLAQIDLTSAGPTVPEAHVTFRATRSGTISGLLLYFEADLGHDVHLSLHPDATDPTNSWSNRVHVLGTPLVVQPGDSIEVRYAYGMGRSQVSMTRESPGGST
jgi:type I protein arginine methyltransferase